MPMIVYTEEEVIDKCNEAEALGAQRAAEARDAAQADVRRLRRALEPFAVEAEIYNEIPGVVITHDNVELWQRRGYQTKLCVGDLRRARDAIGSVKNG